MAELIAQVKIDGFECVEDMAQAVLSWTYKGKTIKEWADSISEPKTNADRIRSMTDEELAHFLAQARAALNPVLNDDKAYFVKEVIKWERWLKEDEA